jgi:hypothetical protein
VRCFEKLTITAHDYGAVKSMPHWPGESVGSVTRAQSAAEIVGELAGKVVRLVRPWEA